MLFLLLILVSFILPGCSEFFTHPEVQHIQELASSGVQQLQDHANQFIESNEYAQEAKNLINSGVQDIHQQATDFLDNNAYAQQAKESIHQAYEQAKNQTSELIDSAKNEVEHHYQNFKEDIKSDIKNTLSTKVDQTFDNF